MARNALGRGLGALIREPEAVIASNPPVAPTGAAAALAPAQAQVPNGSPLQVDIDLIDPSPYQPRTRFSETALEELAQSIRASGIIQPLVVRRAGSRYQLIAGERRWLASQRAGKQTVPAVIKQVSNEQAMEMTIVENLQREDLNPMEQARAFERLSREFKLTQEQMAQRTGKDRASVANFLRLLRLPDKVQALVEGGSLGFGHARALLALESPERIEAAAAKVTALSMSTRQTETYVQGLLNPESKPKKEKAAAPPQDPNVREAQDRLQRKLGLRVHIEDKQGKGRVVIEYSGVDDFDAILSALGG